ncbi:MAG TPA: hypothetical protein VJH03_19845 [Blastocatellia bacterium]|nr:hypothetical protein [Blastocatellia bacterium]
MNWPHVHLILNHIPVIGVPAGLLLLAWGVIRKSEEVKKASLITLAVAAASALPVYFAGTRAEEIGEHLPGVSEALIDTHSSAAGPALTASLILGALALAGFVFLRRAPVLPKWFVVAVLAMSLAVSGLLVRAANLGGEIRHTEIRSDSQAGAGEDEGEVEKGRGRGRGGRGDERGEH